ncbi:hypothetical protein N0V93_008475 [Gnomoniopsis smithogilvyi]|uniref:2EXR domain-containing protein n=1 Tax=Gnomoniopsis smithogilvyi TaxID=1191159 RepID=A0A9W9CUT1_9PEZI|nr:hypothetical protein N0V93_008475 [Gnomoniopsis smithogilvyi]
MLQDYSDEDDFDGFSDLEGAQVYIDNDGPEHHSGLYENEVASDSDKESKRYTGFFDDEASEADSDLESETNSEFSSDGLTPNAFHNFMKLPLELREMIWKRFCPDLSTDPRVYELCFSGRWPKFAAWVEDQNAPLRTVLAVHKETRALGHKFAPHLIRLPSNHGVAACHMERDIIMVDWVFDHRYCPGAGELEALNKAAPGLQNLAVRTGVTLFDGGPDLDRLYSLKNVFVSQDTDIIPTRGLTWCLSDKTRSYHVVHYEDVGAGLSEDVDLLFYWPDPEQYGESGERSFSSQTFGDLQFDEEGLAVNPNGERVSDVPGIALNTSNWGYEIARLREWLDPVHEMMRPSVDPWDEESLSETEEQDIRAAQQQERQEEDGGGERLQGDEENEGRKAESSPPRPQRITVWPLARFMFESGMQRIEAMKAWQKPWEEWDSLAGSDNGEEEDWSDEGTPDSLDGFITFGDTIEPETDDDEEEEEEEVLPAELDTNQQDLDLDDSGDEEETSFETGEPPQPRHRIRTVIDSDESSEGEEGVEGEEENTSPQRAGSSNRRSRARPLAVDSEDDDDDDLPQPSRTGSRRGAVITSDSEDDEDGEDAEHQQDGKAKMKEEDSSSSEEEEDVSDEEAAPPPRISLAKRLRMEAAQARAALASDGSDDDEDQEQDGGGGSYDDEEPFDGDGMGIAEEEDEEDEEAW